MKCPKCDHSLKSAENSQGAKYEFCPTCKGLWISEASLLIVMRNHPFVKEMVASGLNQTAKTKFSCSQCEAPLENGKVGNSELILDRCGSCRMYFFDDKEINQLFVIIKQSELPSAESVTQLINPENLKASDRSCPVCPDAKLFFLKDSENFLHCTDCDGVMTNTVTLESMAKRSLFNPTMFNFRKGGDYIAICRFCNLEQAVRNQDCSGCGREMVRIKCVKCDAKMAEFSLGEVIIERCQFCNDIWLDAEEFEQSLNAMPDIRRRYEEAIRRSELYRAQIRAASEAYSVSMDQSRRKMLDNQFGKWSFFFYDINFG